MIAETIEGELQTHVQVLRQTVSQCASTIAELVDLLCGCFRHENKLLLCGNGGSAAAAQHVAAEFLNRFRRDRAALPAIALSTDTSILTSIANDCAFDHIFARQVEAFAKPGDILVGISTSGRSANVLRALDAARARQAITVGFTGAGGKETMEPKCDYCLAVPSTDPARIQESHEFVWHVICGLVESNLFPEEQDGISVSIVGAEP
jgi:D-sedoheptulose 7-phosphate isomerase